MKCASTVLYLMLVVESEDSFREDIGTTTQSTLIIIASLDPPFIPWLIRILSLMRSKDPAEQAQRYPKQVPATNEISDRS